MQSVQIGLPQPEHETAVSREEWRKQVVVVEVIAIVRWSRRATVISYLA